MITEEAALAHILESVKPLPGRCVSLAQAREQFAVHDIFARLPLPLFDNSQMDGYAVVASSCEIGQRLRVVEEQPAGVDRKLRIKPDEAIRVFTGAPIPEGADAVIMQEDARFERDQIVINAGVEPGEFIRRRGCDLTEGQKILSAGENIRPPTLALLAAQGFADVEIGGQARVSIITTGDELIQPGRSLKAGQIYESNSILLQSLVRNCEGKIETVEHCPDEANSIESALRKGLGSELIIIAGGVSVGARDLVKPALTSIGAKTELWRVSVKPGKPFLFGRASRCAIFGLPGNPVSAFMTFLLFVRPAILRMMGAGADQLSLPRFYAQLTERVENRSDRPHYVRGRVIDGKFTPVGRQESHALYGLSRANGLLRIPPGDRFAKDSPVPVLVYE